MTCSEALSCLCSVHVNTPALFISQIHTVDESFKVKLEFTSSKAEVEKNLNDIIKYVLYCVLVKFEFFFFVFS